MRLESALNLLDESLGRLATQADAESWGMEAWYLWWCYEQYRPLSQDLAMTEAGTVPRPIALVEPTTSGPVTSDLRCDTQERAVSVQNVSRLRAVTVDAAPAEAIHRAMTASVMGTYAQLLREAARPGNSGTSEGKRLRQEADAAEQAAAQAEAALEGLSDLWSAGLRELQRRLEEAESHRRTTVTPLPVRLRS